MVYAKAPIDVGLVHDGPLGQYFAVLQERAAPLQPEQAYSAYLQQQAVDATSPYLNFGLASEPVWLFARLRNNAAQPAVRLLSIETSWLDRIEIYHFQGAVQLSSALLGDGQPFASRPLANRYFVERLSIPAGDSVLMLRVSTPDPMVMPIRLTTMESVSRTQVEEGYHYGFLYGVIVALMLYNLMIAVSLRIFAHLSYAAYMLSFMVMNLSYSGHGFDWFWRDQVTFQKWSNPLFMSLYLVMGLVFAGHFLQLKEYWPRMYQAIKVYIALVIFSMAGSVVVNSHQVAIQLAFFYVLIFTFWVAYMGLVALRKGLASARYFFAATLIGVTGACITCLTVWGLIPYRHAAYMAIDFGMMLEAVLLSLALADRVGVIISKKDRAEYLARTDPLTELCNRRAAVELIAPAWERSKHCGTPFATIILDIDNFKSINDSFGHDVGDSVIVQVANILKRNSRVGDITVRWGGEEFIICLPDTNLQQAHNLAERLRSEMAQLTIGADQRRSVTGSFGVVEREPGDVQLDQLFKRADQLLYQAKSAGRNRVAVNEWTGGPSLATDA